MVVSEVELRKLIERELRRIGLESVVDYDASQFLIVPEGPFVELVLRDASFQSAADSVLASVSDELRRDGIVLDGIVRSRWQIRRIWYLGPSRTPEGGLAFALAFGVELESGKRDHQIRVHVTLAALTVLRQSLGKEKFLMHGWSPEKGDVDEENIKAAVRAYLEIVLERGGLSYWDPLTNRELEINESAMSFALGHSPAFQELRSAVTDAFSETVVRSFLNSLSLSRGTLARFETVLPELSNMLGGAFRHGQRFSISAQELFDSLNAGERELIRQYVSLCAQKVRSEHPELVATFPKVFGTS